MTQKITSPKKLDIRQLADADLRQAAHTTALTMTYFQRKLMDGKQGRDRALEMKEWWAMTPPRLTFKRLI